MADEMNSIVFPAPAGMNRQAEARKSGLLRVPRASGDEPARRAANKQVQRCSPRQRG